MSTEERLREAMRAHTDAVEPEGEWEHVRHRTRFAARRQRVLRAGGAVIAVAAMVAVAVLAVPALLDDTEQVEVVPPADTTPDTGPVTTLPPTTVPTPGDWIWDSGSDSAEDAARGFAIEYLGMRDPIVTGLGDGPVTVQAIDRGPATELDMELLDGTWKITDAFSENIRVAGPRPDESITSPVQVIGEARAFEGTVQVEVRQDGQEFGESLGTGFVTGSGGPDLGPFEGSIEFDPPTEAAGAVVFWVESAEDGSVLEATVVRVRFGDGTAATRDVEIWFSTGDEDFASVTRDVAAQSPLRGALTELLAGPTEEERRAGLSSFFSEDAAGMLADVNLTADGTAVVDFDPALAETIPNASTSAGSAALIGQLDRTIFQFETVEAIEYRLGGDCEAFWNWLQGSCHAVTREALDGE